MQVKLFSHSINSGFSDLEEAAELDSENTLVLAFASPEYRNHPKVFEEVGRMFGKSQICGCSTSGEIYKDNLFDLSISFAVIKFSKKSFEVSYSQIDAANQSKGIGKEMAKKLARDDLSGVFILSDGLNANGSALIEGVNEEVNSSKITIAGGLAGDGNQFSQTWVLQNGMPKENYICMIGLYGAEINLSTGTQGGWDKFGPERHITKSTGNVLYEIDGEPALELYKRYLGQKADQLPASGLLFPLQIRQSSDDTRPLVRTMLAIDEEKQSITYAGDVPEGSLAQLMKANFDRVIDASQDAADACKKGQSDLEQGDNLVIAVSCVGRRLALGERAEEEVEALRMSLGVKANIVGFYSYGELCSHQNGTPCELHNQTMTLLSITNKAA